MAKKMYYNEQEAMGKLGVSAADLNRMVREGKIHSYPDGPRKVYKAEEVDKLAPAAPAEIELTPADSAIDTVSLTEADGAKPATKEDTVITAEGISIFDDEDLEIEADPMAKTQISPSLADQSSIDGVGSGSGLLDLTRESDDTSLGDVGLDQIDMDQAVGGEIGSDISEPQAMYSAAPEVLVVEAAGEVMDAGTGFFSGLLVGATLVSLLLGITGLAAMQGVMPGFLAGMRNNVLAVIGGSLVLCVIAGVLGLMMGKAIVVRQAMRRA